MMNRKVVKIICIVLACLMGISAVAVLLKSFAIDGAAFNPSTGVEDLPVGLFAAIIGVAVVAVVICLVLPKLKKKNKGE